MNTLECIQNFQKNMRTEQISASYAQVLLSILDGKRRVHSIIRTTGLHPNTVGNILRMMTHENLISRYGENKPYIYRTTRKGECMCYNLLKPTEKPRLNE